MRRVMSKWDSCSISCNKLHEIASVTLESHIKPVLSADGKTFRNHFSFYDNGSKQRFSELPISYLKPLWDSRSHNSAAAKTHSDAAFVSSHWTKQRRHKAAVNLIICQKTVSYHMDAVMLCCDWDPDPPLIIQSDKDELCFFFFCSRWHHIITICK